jgi:hypothetical protein
MNGEFKRYRRKQIAELRPYVQGENMDGISVSDADAEAGSPKAGDMIARNPENHEDSGWSPPNTSLTTSRPREHRLNEQDWWRRRPAATARRQRPGAVPDWLGTGY